MRSVADILRAKGSNNRVLTVAPTATVLEAISLMAQYGVGALVVVNSAGSVIGIITEPMADVSATAEPERFPKIMQATELTTESPPGSRPTKTLANATIRFARPPAPRSCPVRMKKGMAYSTGPSFSMRSGPQAAQAGGPDLGLVAQIERDLAKSVLAGADGQEIAVKPGEGKEETHGLLLG